MRKHFETGSVGLTIVDRNAKKELKLCANADRNVGHVLELATARGCAADTLRTPGLLRIRREGDLLPLNCEALVGEILRHGDRLIVEPATGVERISAVEEDDFRAVAVSSAIRMVSQDSAAFIQEVRQNFGE